MQRSLIALMVVAGLFVAGACLAQAQPLKLGIVDMDAVGTQYKDLSDRQMELQNWVKERRAFLNAMQDFMFISSDEFAEVAKIFETPKAQWTDVQKTREAAVRKIAEDNERKFLDLQAKPNRTAEEQNVYNTMRDTFQARDRDLKAFSRTFDDQLKQRRDEVQEKLAGSVRAAIEQYAKAQGFNAVFDKSVVFYAGEPLVDITAEILKALNAGKPAPAAGGGNAGGGTPPQ